MAGDSNRGSVPDYLDMGIHDSAGTVWLPKAIYPERNKAKMFVSSEFAHGDYINLRCRSAYMRPSEDEEGFYRRCNAEDEGAFACWEIT